jgi:hypothetical protein
VIPTISIRGYIPFYNLGDFKWNNKKNTKKNTKKRAKLAIAEEDEEE